MTAASPILGAMAALDSKPVPKPQSTLDASAAKKSAKEFEAVFISQFMGSMFEGLSTDGPFGGGQGEGMFRSLMMDQYGKAIADRGGFGLSGAVMRSLLSHQHKEPQPAADAAP